MTYGGKIYAKVGGYARYKRLLKDQKALCDGTKEQLSKKEELAVKWVLAHGVKMPPEEWQEQSIDHWNAVNLIADIQHEEINREAYDSLLDNDPQP